MFGYVVVDKSALRIREYDYYKSAYCGLCHAMGKCTGCLSRLTLSYDMTFFVLLRQMLEKTNVEFEKKRCIRHPIKSVNTIKIEPQLEYSAYLGGILTAGKIVDNIQDEKSIKRLGAKFVRVLFSTMEKRSNKKYSELYNYIRERLSELSALEEKRTASIDEPANIFGMIMARALSYGFEGEKKVVAENIGKRIGRWIYIVDALDDYEKDKKSGSYNPFVLLYNGESFTKEDIISISMMLEAELSLAFSAIDLLDNDEDANRGEIIKNILCLGMPASVKRVCDKKEISIDNNILGEN